MKKSTPKPPINLQKFITNGWILLVIALLIIIVSTLALGLPSYNQTISLRQELNNQKDLLNQLVQKDTQLKNLDLNLIDSQLELLDSAIPYNKPIFEVLSSINQQASVAGVLIDNYSFSPGEIATQSATTTPTTSSEETPVPGKLANMPFLVTISGEFDKILEFIKVLTQSIPLADPVIVVLNQSSSELDPTQTNPENLFSASLDLNYYFLLPPDTIGEPHDPIVVPNDQDLANLQTLNTLSKYFLPPPRITIPEFNPNPFAFL